MSAVTLRLSCVVELRPGEIPEAGLAAVKEHYTRVSPKTCVWGPPNSPVAYWSEKNGKLLLPRGDLRRLHGLLQQAGCRVRFDATGMSAGHALAPAPRLRGEPRPYQVLAARALVQQRQGVVILPPGAGKTFVAMSALAQVGRSALVLLPTLDLVQQWREELQSRLGIEAGCIAGGQRKLRPVTLATVQSLMQLTDAELFELGRRFGVTIHDEVHQVPASGFYRVQNLMAAAYRWGLTATPEREDGLEFLADLVVGPELHRTSYPELVAAGWLMQPQVAFVRTAFTPSNPEALTSASWKERRKGRIRLDQELIRDPARNQLAVDLAVEGLKRGQTVLVLTGRVAHAVALAWLIRQRGFEAFPLTARMSKPVRRKIFARFRSRRIRCIVATQLADYGLDIPQLERTILVFPGKARGRTAQRTGRGLRLFVGKTRTQCFDLLDERVPMLCKRAEVRRDVYRTSFDIDPQTIDYDPQSDQ